MRNLLIIGSGQYGILAKEIAIAQNLYQKIDFIDDRNSKAIGKINEISKFKKDYNNIIVAIGNPYKRNNILNECISIGFNIVNLISERSYISPSAKLGKGIIVEPMAVIQTESIIEDGCIISSGAIINHNCLIKEVCHINCNVTINANTTVLEYSKISI